MAADTPADQGIAALADVGLDRQVEIAGFMDQAADFLAAWVTSTNSTCWRGGMYGTPYVIGVTPWIIERQGPDLTISASGRNLPTHRRWTAVVKFLMMEGYKHCMRAKRGGFRRYALPLPLLGLVVQGKYLVGALRVGEQVGVRLGAWHTLRGVTGKTIDPAW